LQDFLGRQARAQAWALGHPAEYARLYSDQTGLSPEVGRLVVAHMNVHMVPIDDAIVRAHQEVAELFFEAGVIWQRIDVVPAFDRSRFLDAGPTPRAPAP